MLELIILINLIRTNPLQQNAILTNIAQERAEYLCDHPFSHNGWMKYESEFPFRGENLARNFPNVISINQAFMNSPTHKSVMVDKNFQYVGIGSKCGIIVEEFGGFRSN